MPFSRQVSGFCTASVLIFRCDRFADDELTWQFLKGRLHDITRSKSCTHSGKEYDLKYGS